MTRLCIVCGARIARRGKTRTCDHTCTKAAHYGLTRGEMVQREVRQRGSFAGITSEMKRKHELEELAAQL